jgi:adenine-specific DNA-methyltransferase
VKKEAETTARTPPDHKTENDIRKGFVYKRVPHVTLKSIANNPEIDLIHAKWREKLEPIRAKLNALLGQSWEEWQIPRSLTPSLSHGEREGKKPSPAHAGEGGEAQAEPGEGERLLTTWWELRRRRQAEIDASIARDAETELLYDQPYDDPKRVRVAGPFTVESLSPHRVLAADLNRDGEVSEAEANAHADFIATLLSTCARRASRIPRRRSG